MMQDEEEEYGGGEGVERREKTKEEKLRFVLSLQRNGGGTLQFLDKKFQKHGFSEQERVKHLQKAVCNTVDANVFFDFEAYPQDPSPRIPFWTLQYN